MQTENDIINSLERYFISKGGKILKKCTTTQKGVDLEVQFGTDLLLIEAKGETSARNGSGRFGEPFRNDQITNHIGRAILTTIKLQTLHQGESNRKYAIAFPGTDSHRKQLAPIAARLKELDISVFLVTGEEIEKLV